MIDNHRSGRRVRRRDRDRRALLDALAGVSVVAGAAASYLLLGALLSVLATLFL